MALVDSLSAMEEKGVTTLEKVRLRVSTLERAALAARAFAMIQHARVSCFYFFILLNSPNS